MLIVHKIHTLLLVVESMSLGSHLYMVSIHGKECCCCMPSETYGRNGVTQIFRSFHRTASSTTGGWSRWNILMCFLYIILSTTVSFLEDTILF